MLSDAPEVVDGVLGGADGQGVALNHHLVDILSRFFLSKAEVVVLASWGWLVLFAIRGSSLIRAIFGWCCLMSGRMVTSGASLALSRLSGCGCVRVVVVGIPLGCLGVVIVA
jgi:hypothetical protein